MPDPSIQALESLSGAVTQLADALEPEFQTKAPPKAGVSAADRAKLKQSLARAVSSLRDAGAALVDFAGSCDRLTASLPSKADLTAALTLRPQPPKARE